MRESAFALWRQMGITTVLVDGYTMGRYEHLVNEFVPWDPRDGTADIEKLIELGRGCDGITTLDDGSQVTAAWVAAGLDLPGVGRASAKAARSKLIQRQLCSLAGLPVPRWRQVRDRSDIAHFYADGLRPAVLKPVDCAGSAGVLEVDGPDDAAQKGPIVRMLSPSRTVLIEDFIDGREVCVESVVVGGEPIFVSVCQPEYDNSEGFLAVSALYSAVQPDRVPATDAMRRVASALGVTDAVMQAEFKVVGHQWITLEATLRVGGALVPDLTARVTGVNLYEAQARLALGLDPLPAGDPEVLQTPHAQVRFLIGHGLVRRFVPPATILPGLPDVKVAHQLVARGQQIRRPLSEDGRAGYAAGWGPDADRLDHQLRLAITRLGEQMGLTLYDTQRRSQFATTD